ncbi:MAG: NUDIX hydrolase [Pseudomonadota bacterium]
MTLACGAVIRGDEILMVRHTDHGNSYWTLPGGKIEEGETPAEAASREVREETTLALDVQRYLFSTTSPSGTVTQCFLMTPPQPGQVATLGEDPEQAHLSKRERLLQGVAWHQLDAMRDDVQVSELIRVLGRA